MFNSATYSGYQVVSFPHFSASECEHWNWEGWGEGAWYLFSRSKTWSFIIGKGLERLATLTKWLERPQLAGQPGTFSLHAVLIPPPPPHPPWCIMWSFYFPSTSCGRKSLFFFVMWPWCNQNRARVFRIERQRFARCSTNYAFDTWCVWYLLPDS